jgi:integrase
MPPRERDDHLFGDGGTGFQGWSKAKAALDRRILAARKRAAELARKPANDTMAESPWTLHDIRRTVATGMAELGVQPHVVESLLNHVSGHKAGVAGTYNRAIYEREVRAALAMWADHLRAIVDGGARKVVALHERGAATA